MFRRPFLIAMIAITAVLASLSCSPCHAAGGLVTEVRIADSKGDWGYPNPYRHYPRGPGYIRMSWVFDTLIWKDRNGYTPALAESWSFDHGKLAFTFRLNPKAKWHDGRPVTAHDVVFTLEYFKKHPYSWISLDSVDRGVAQGPHEVTICLSKPYSPFLSDIGGTMPVLPRHIWEGVENPDSFDDSKAFIGSGSFLFKDFNKAHGAYLFEAFKDYYRGRPKAERLIYVRSGKPLVSLANGEVDLAQIQPEMAELLKQKGMAIIRDERGWLKKLMVNHRKPPFDDKRFRQALAYAINRQEIVDKSHRGFAHTASHGLLSVDHDMYNPKTPTYPHDPDKSRGIIESLGYQKGTDGRFIREGRPLKIELLASSITVGGQSVADRDGEVMKKQLESIGIQVDLVNLEQTTTDSRVKNWIFDLALSGHGGVSGDARILNEMISSQWGAGSVNSARYDANPELNRLMEDQMVEMDEAKRKQIVFRIQELHAEDLPAICLHYPDSLSAYDPKKGIEWFYTRGGISKGIPIPQNKMSLIGE
ncbi:MAG: peptide-binding protein [Deltaproteobacteria bacterium HGW-Deltaproteobacteria-15]|nr:MAG: peptide-binding protein [Deltaproteobacteria bacterium HGW-Deltaproteobacteria-15]